MKLRTVPIALLSLFAGSAGSQTPPVVNAETAAPAFDLRSDSVRQVVRDTAATQYADTRETLAKPVESTPKVVRYEPPEKPAEFSEISLPSEPPPQLSAPLTAILDIAVSELLGIEPVDDVTAANEILRCRVQKDIRSAPQPGTDHCPQAD